MEPLKMLYPNNYFWNSNVHKGPNFHWALCGKKVWIPEISQYYLEISPSARFFDIKTGKTYRPPKKGKLRLLMYPKLKEQNIPDILPKIEKFDLDGVTVSGEKKYDLNGAWCPSMNFVFLDGLREIENASRCPLIRFVKINNSRLREINPKLPTCQEIDTLLKEKTCIQVCREIAEILNSK